MFTFEELYANFDKFREIFCLASHEPFDKVYITIPIQPGQQMYSGMELRRRQDKGLPPVYLDPELGYIAKIIFYIRYDEKYNFLITPEGGISFKGTGEFIKQPKMKWAKLITKWLQNCPSASKIRHMSRFSLYKEEILATIYSPERMTSLGANIEDRSNIEHLLFIE